MPEPGRWDAKLNRIHFIPHNATDAKSLNCTGIYTFFLDASAGKSLRCCLWLLGPVF